MLKEEVREKWLEDPLGEILVKLFFIVIPILIAVGIGFVYGFKLSWPIIIIAIGIILFAYYTRHWT